MADGFIAYQSEEHGLGFQAARDVAERTVDRLVPTRRVTTSETLAALISRNADKAIIPYETDASGYNLEALLTLIDYQGYVIAEEIEKRDDYCLAVPTVAVHELAQAAHPGSFAEKLPIGNLPSSGQANYIYRKRLETVYVSADALGRCGAAIDAFRAEGIDVVKLEEGTDPYRDVLRRTREWLDPDRKIQTSYDDVTLKRVSESRAANFIKPLHGVLLPYEVAMGGQVAPNKGSNDTGDSFGWERDYIILQDGIAASKKITSRFLVLERKPKTDNSLKKAGALVGAAPAIVAAQKLTALALKQPSKIRIEDDTRIPHTHKRNHAGCARMLLKLNSRGENVADIHDVTAALARAGIGYTPIYLHEEKEHLPVILEIEVDGSRVHKKGLEKALKQAFAPHRRHAPSILGMFGADTAKHALTGVPARSARWGLHNAAYTVLFVCGVVLTIVLLK